MAYQALYRKWRPMRFADFVGQENIIATLRNQIQSRRIAHAYLFCGTRGTGKTSTAKMLARAVNCENPEDGEPCGICRVCLALNEENNLDIVEIDAASNNGVDEIRDLREKVKYPPQSGRYRVYIIDEVHMLSTGAFNALLKTLEEPPEYVVFILATTEPQKLPATVLSRCQRFDFRRIPAAQIVGRLKEAADDLGVTAQMQALDRIARAAEGGMRDAFSTMDMCLSYAQGELTEDIVLQVLGASDRGFLFRFSQNLIDGSTQKVLLMVDELMQSGREPQVFAKDLSGHLRTMLMVMTCGEAFGEQLDLTKEDTALFVAQAKQCSQMRLLRMLDQFLACETDMKWSSQPRIALEVAAVRACMPEQSQSLDALIERIETLEKKIEQGIALAPARAAAPTKASATDKKPTAQQANAAPVAQTADAAPSGNADPQAIWKKVMQYFKKSAPAVFGSLALGRFDGCKDGVYSVLFPQGTGAIYVSMFTNEAKQTLVEQALASAGAPGARFLAALEGSAPTASEEKSASQTLNQIFTAFGRENVQVVDD